MAPEQSVYNVDHQLLPVNESGLLPTSDETTAGEMTMSAGLL